MFSAPSQGPLSFIIASMSGPRPSRLRENERRLAALLVLQALCFALSSQRVAIVDVPAHIYLGMGGSSLDCWVLVEDSGKLASAAARGLAIELWLKFDLEEPYMGARADVSLQFRQKFSISINTPGSLLLRAVLKPADSAEGVDDGSIAHAQHLVDISELQSPLFARAHKDVDVRLLDEDEAQEFAAAAVRMYAPTARIIVQRIVHAFSIGTTPAHFVRCICAYLFTTSVGHHPVH
jgi:hypothetical protein